MINKLKSLKRDNRGQALVLVALSMVVLIGAVALSVDYGYMAYQRRSLQNAADSAALAAAWELPNVTRVNNKANEYAKMNASELEDEEIKADPQNSNEEVKVDVTHEYDLFFGKVLGVDSSTIAATATARVIKEWKGEAIPLINLDYNYNEYSPVDAWIKISSGTNGSINDFYTLGTVDGPDFYYEIEYENGVEIQKGFASGNKGFDNVTPLHDGLTNILNRYDFFYIFSLRHDIIESGFVNVDGEPKSIYELNNKDVIDRDQLVLLEVEFTETWSVSDHTINLKYTGNSYDLITEFPTEHLTSPGIASELTK